MISSQNTYEYLTIWEAHGGQHPLINVRCCRLVATPNMHDSTKQQVRSGSNIKLLPASKKGNQDVKRTCLWWTCSLICQSAAQASTLFNYFQPYDYHDSQIVVTNARNQSKPGDRMKLRKEGTWLVRGHQCSLIRWNPPLRVRVGKASCWGSGEGMDPCHRCRSERGSRTAAGPAHRGQWRLATKSEAR
jgi:hypothetical protein